MQSQSHETQADFWQPIRSWDRATWFLTMGMGLLIIVWQLLHREGIYYSHIAPSLGSVGTYQKALGAWIFYHGAGLVLIFLIPLLWMWRLEGMRLSQLGLGLGDRAYWQRLVGWGALPAIAIAFAGSFDPQIASEYPLGGLASGNLRTFVLWECVYLIYYIAWEGCFRGVMLFGLKEKLGLPAAILWQTAFSCMVHVGKPSGEWIGSLPAGIVFALIALRAKSLWPVLILHALIGMATDAASIWQTGGFMYP